jgi:hypothetical protein
MARETIVVPEHDSILAEFGDLIVSVDQITFQDRTAEVVVGRPGLPNLKKVLGIGSAVLFETPSGLFEIRVLSVSFQAVKILLTEVSPHPGIAGGFVDQGADNLPFTPPELIRIAVSIRQIRQVMSERSDIKPEQLDLISRKLDEMQHASERLGRKDWMNYAIGTLTSIIVTAAFAPDVAKALLKAAGTALSWVYSGGILLLP